MTGTPRKAAIDNARALLDALVTNGWAEVHVVSGDVEIFIAANNGRENPMRVSTALAAPEPQVDLTTTTVTAPHVATVVSVTAAGSTVVQGAVVATIAVLDDEEVVTAPTGGRVTTVHVEIDRLVEFGTPLLEIAAS